MSVTVFDLCGGGVAECVRDTWVYQTYLWKIAAKFTLVYYSQNLLWICGTS
jgi:hypothetical protein